MTQPGGQPLKLAQGMGLPGIKKRVTQQNINRYAEASGDFNPIHLDEEFARQTSLGGTVAHGMLILAYISEMMTAAFGRDWLAGGKLNVRFRTAARPGDTITTSGGITGLEKREGQTIVTCAVRCDNEKGDSVIAGEAILAVRSDSADSQGP